MLRPEEQIGHAPFLGFKNRPSYGSGLITASIVNVFPSFFSMTKFKIIGYEHQFKQ